MNCKPAYSSEVEAKRPPKGNLQLSEKQLQSGQANFLGNGK